MKEDGIEGTQAALGQRGSPRSPAREIGRGGGANGEVREEAWGIRVAHVAEPRPVRRETDFECRPGRRSVAGLPDARSRERPGQERLAAVRAEPNLSVGSLFRRRATPSPRGAGIAVSDEFRGDGSSWRIAARTSEAVRPVNARPPESFS